MILINLIGPQIELARRRPEYRYALQRGYKIKFYSEFTFNRRRWQVYEINPGRERFRMPRASITFTEAVLDKYGLEGSETPLHGTRGQHLWFSAPPSAMFRKTLLDLDNSITFEVDGYSYTCFEFEVFDTKFVMFN